MLRSSLLLAIAFVLGLPLAAAPAEPSRPIPWGAWEPAENQLRKRILPLPEMGNDPRETIYFLPSSWAPGARLPLVIALPGGRAIAENLVASQPHLLVEAQRHGFLLLVPSSSMAYSSVLPSGKPLQDVHEDYVFRAIEIARGRFGADSERMFLIGFSSGGSGVWSLAKRHPDRFLAIAPIAPGGSPDREELKRIAHIPTFLAQAADDHAIRRWENRRAARILEDLGAPITFFEPVHGSHGLQEYPVIRRAFELFRREADRAGVRGTAGRPAATPPGAEAIVWEAQSWEVGGRECRITLSAEEDVLPEAARRPHIDGRGATSRVSGSSLDGRAGQPPVVHRPPGA